MRSGGFFDLDFIVIKFKPFDIRRKDEIPAETSYEYDDDVNYSSDVYQTTEGGMGARKEIETRSWSEERWRDVSWPAVSDAPSWIEDIYNFFHGQLKEREERSVKELTVRSYNSDGQLIDETTQVETTEWISTGEQSVRPAKIAVAPFSVNLITITFPNSNQSGQQNPAQDNQYSDTVEPDDSEDFVAVPIIDTESPQVAGPREELEGLGGSRIQVYTYSQKEGEVGKITNPTYTKILGQADYSLSPGDIILAPGVTPDQVKSAGFGKDGAEFFTIPYDQLMWNRVQNSQTNVPRNYKFLVVQEVDIIPASLVTKYSENGEFVYSKSRTNVVFESYKFIEE